MSNTRIIAGYLIGLLLLINLAYADLYQDQARKLIGSKTPCNELSEEQLVTIGQFYLERMYYGSGREFVYRRIGDDAESLRFVYIELARRIYCNQTNETIYSNQMNEIMENWNRPSYANGNVAASYDGSSPYLEIFIWSTISAVVFYWLIKNYRRKYGLLLKKFHRRDIAG